ncbi:VOC family protein [Marinobacterium jannaschii]|uniref:VOC family protein n=1 Tax=Marinobacterium jannaschii TaxID=64970 RepID=UPI0004809B0D|nr:VOC family protein [Marinobacterium jannaschii]
MRIEPYLMFGGRSEEAIKFYKEALGAEVAMLMYFRDCPEPECIPPGAGDKVMHATLNIAGYTLMLSDGDCSGESSFSGISLSISTQTLEAAEAVFGALSENGEVQMPLAKTFWSEGFGMLKDRFGVSWMVNVTEPQG